MEFKFKLKVPIIDKEIVIEKSEYKVLPTLNIKGKIKHGSLYITEENRITLDELRNELLKDYGEYFYYIASGDKLYIVRCEDVEFKEGLIEFIPMFFTRKSEFRNYWHRPANTVTVSGEEVFVAPVEVLSITNIDHISIHRGDELAKIILA